MVCFCVAYSARSHQRKVFLLLYRIVVQMSRGVGTGVGNGGFCNVTMFHVMLRFQKRCGTAAGRVDTGRYVVGVSNVILLH